jgi:hypothetical protein
LGETASSEKRFRVFSFGAELYKYLQKYLQKKAASLLTFQKFFLRSINPVIEAIGLLCRDIQGIQELGGNTTRKLILRDPVSAFLFHGLSYPNSGAPRPPLVHLLPEAVFVAVKLLCEKLLGADKL